MNRPNAQSLPVPDGVVKQVIRGVFVAQLEDLKNALNLTEADNGEDTDDPDARLRRPFPRMQPMNKSTAANIFSAASSCSIAASFSRRMKKWRMP